MTRTFLAELEYDGGGYHGWQRQAAGRTVQEAFESILTRLADRSVRAQAAGRTDAGVHASAMAVSFDMPDRWEPAALLRALNALLAPDCWVAAVHEMRPGFRARHDATGRRYRYVVGTDAAAASPFRRRYEWALGRPLEAAELRSAAEVVLGTHDFRGFSVRGQEMAHYKCSIRHASWSARASGVGYSFEIEADRFLHHMVRMLVGTMVEIGLGRRPGADMRQILVSHDNQRTSPPAPAEGLYFVQARFPEPCFLGSRAVAR